MPRTKSRTKPEVVVITRARRLKNTVLVVIELRGLTSKHRKQKGYKSARSDFKLMACMIRGVVGRVELEIDRDERKPVSECQTWHFRVHPNLPNYVVENLSELAEQIFNKALNE